MKKRHFSSFLKDLKLPKIVPDLGPAFYHLNTSIQVQSNSWKKDQKGGSELKKVQCKKNFRKNDKILDTTKLESKSSLHLLSITKLWI